ncbi:MAG: cysteine--tRNA ligase [Acidobacteriota bacterium]|nr:cysteine--tRNA ligase [Acidobacteriota bacterium]
MALRLTNTLTSQLEELQPLDGETVRMYACGPTVYDYCHIGNFRTFVFQDLLRRYIKHRGFHLKHVMNITDVDDKIIRGSLEAGISIQEFTKPYVEAFFEDMEKLGIEKPDLTPFATDHIEEMIQLVAKLKKGGHTYQSGGSTYYRISSFPGYGKLSRVDLSGSQITDPTDADEYTKENPRDFVVWKAKKEEGEASWETSLGVGRPGWHLECSAMSMKYLGESFDLHCGGVDLVFPHHENEIAQSEASTGRPFVQHWIHSEFLQVEGEKMSKSRGNQYTLRDLIEQGYDPLAIRYLLQSVHYRKQLNFTFEGVSQAGAALSRIKEFLLRINDVQDGSPENTALTKQVFQKREDFLAGLDNDLNTSIALGSLFELIRSTNILLDRQDVGAINRDHIIQFFDEANQIFAFFETHKHPVADEEISQLIQQREEARQQHNFQKADEIRNILLEKGITLEDTKTGTRWKETN